MKQGCRDCGYQLEVAARGCPRCARNVEAEQMIERFIWRRLVPLLIAALVVGVIAVRVYATLRNVL